MLNRRDINILGNYPVYYTCLIQVAYKSRKPLVWNRRVKKISINISVSYTFWVWEFCWDLNMYSSCASIWSKSRTKRWKNYQYSKCIYFFEENITKFSILERGCRAYSPTLVVLVLNLSQINKKTSLVSLGTFKKKKKLCANLFLC